MRKHYFLCTLVLGILFSPAISAQDFSNKGKDFWVGYGYHQIMVAGNAQEMVLYFATEAITTVTVTIPGTGYSQTYSNIPANSVLTSSPIPKTGVQDARLLTESTAPENKGIHITSDHPIVAYAHIYNSSVSGACILFPTPTLGKEYFSINYTNTSNTANSNCWFYVVACDTGTTTVEITPSAATINHPAGVPFTVTLTQGQIYNLMGQLTTNNNPYKGVDLTGSYVRSLSTAAGGCKRISLFSGSGRISITCNGSSSSSDNYMVQAFPKAAWGKKYLTASTGGNQSNNIYRVCVSDPTTVVTLNGLPIGLPLQNNFYYEIAASTTPKLIQADKPILVAQYLTSQGACGNGAQPGDPEVIYLSAVEQNINKVLWNATPNFAILQHYYNVIIPNTGTAISSFKLDGVPVSPALFIPHPQAPGYSYLVQQLATSGKHIIESDSGFNAIAYGYGNAESYGYNAGTNIKDLFQYVTIQNPQASVNFPATCKNTSFYFSMTFPYQPTSIQWVFNGLFPDVTLTNPVPTSTTVVNGRTLYTYKLATPYILSTVGVYPIKVVATNPTPDGCGNNQEIEYDLQVFDTPVAEFNFTTTGCLTNPVLFQDNPLNTTNRPVAQWYWDFAGTGTSTVANPSYTFPAPGSLNVRHVIITDIGCVSDTLTHVVNISNPPVALFTTTTPSCVGKPITFNDASSVPGANTLVKWTWDFGDASPLIIATTNAAQTHIYAAAGSYTAKLIVETASGCVSLAYSLPVTISVNPVAGFNLPSICLPTGFAQFNDQSTIPAGSVTGWAWNFGDAGTAIIPNPAHTYAAAGPYNVSLTVTSDKGCTDTKIQVLNSVYAEPQPAFTAPAEVCLGNTASFTDNSVAAGSSVFSWAWDFGDATTSTLQNPVHTYAAAGTYTVTLKVTSAAGCQTVNNTASHTILVKALPTAGITGNAIVCLNAASPNITFNGITGSPPFTFTYSINNGANQTITTTSGNSVTLPVPTTTAGSYTYSLVSVQGGTTTLCSQAQTGSVTVTVNPLPTATIAGATTVCLNSPSPNITFTGAGGTAPYTFTYKINAGPNQTVTTSAGNSVTVPVPATTAGTYTYTLVSVQEGSANLCSQAQAGSVVVTVNALPTATISGTTEVCLNSTSPNITFTGAGGTAPYTFTYRINGGAGQTVSTSNGNSVTVAVPTSTAGTFTYTLLNVQEGSATLCSQVQIGSAIVTVNPLPTGNFNFSLPSCETRTISFTDASVANAGAVNSWQWNFADPSSGAAANTSTLQNPVHTFAGSGTYNVTLIATTNKGCVSPLFTKPVVINARPKAGFISPEICLTDPAAPFVDTSRIAPGSIVAWAWNFGDPNANAGNPNTSTQQNTTHRYSIVGPYTATLIVTSNNGCKDTVTQTFTVNGSVPIAGFTVQNAAALCSNQDVNITDASTIDFGSLIRVEIYWDYTNNPTIKTIDNTPVNGEVYSHTYPEFGTPFTKTYTVRYVAYSGINCVSSVTKTITVLATPTLQFSNIAPICSNVSSFQVSQVQLLNGLSGAGVFTGTGVTPSGIFSPSVSGAGSFTIRYTYTGTNTCTNYVENTIEIYQTPAVNAGPDKIVLEGGVVTLTPALNSGLPVTYLWTPPTGLSSTVVPGPVASPKDDITYTLTVVSDKGCTASDNVFVKVLKAPVIPNIFSPNGDGVHDKWIIGYLESYPGCTVEIYNRYGQLIFKSTGYSKPWDGTINGKDAPIGTYYYIIDPKNGRQKVAGYVDIIR